MNSEGITVRSIPNSIDEIQKLPVGPQIFPVLGKITIEKRFPSHNLVECTNKDFSVIVLAGSGKLLWWNNPENQYETIDLTPGQFLDIKRSIPFSFEPAPGDKLELLFISIDNCPFKFQKIIIN